MSSLDRQVGVVTGAGTGIGLAIATRLGKEGMSLVLVDHDYDLVMLAKEKLAEIGIEAIVVVGDVGESKTSEQAANKADQMWGRIDVLVNNAGIAGNDGNIWELSVQELDRVYRTNLRGTFLFCHHLIPHMIKRNYGRIINIASVAGKEGNPRMVPYSSTKAAVIGLTKAVGKELALTGIRVNCVTPAVVQTRILEQLTADQVEYMVDRIPMRRMGESDEVAALVAWLASKECSFSTGAVFDISGGRATY